MSLRSFFDRSFWLNLFTMPLKGGEWNKINKRVRQQPKDGKNEAQQNNPSSKT